MLVKVLGGMDFIGGIFLIFLSGTKFPFVILLVFGIILLVKSGIGLLKDFASWIDLAAGILFMFLVFFPIHWIFCLIIGVLLIQKGIVSFL